MEIITDLATIAQHAEEKEAENQAFKAFLSAHDGTAIDRLVGELDTLITPQIDCTTCGNCCRTLMIGVTEEEVTALATHLQRSPEDVKAQYIETGSGYGDMLMNTIPCHFLDGNKCSIYEKRFQVCRDFPALHHPGFTGRLFAMQMHYGRCLIIYNVMEEMKKRLAFANS
ncbi:YkgJ family cysteine cluster protein [Chitinophaga rhizophila]|uniref:YkgJ family cysteine cluster protein n=1 Tax=Chitinophaga rhizophila TaxID=2866212 RepID=A0ABS7GLE6_9BACT|nr:YkgJ family cysteine cluster protein [Chitinophaga rhizophila]MBW8687995.1 YkgJ family cysteine cluster protein [Chitinophaga rhizophila]